MTEKKISRRGFIKGLAVCSVVVPFLPKMLEAKPEMIVGIDKVLEGSDNTSVHLVTWGKDSVEVYSEKVIKKGLPPMKWRNIETGKVRHA
ncbi:hypothetical protein KAR91_36790 [Candidatus Pacearchaeota archaeon]|nr:hypothetical protein [Candidatus Pacearchaeota archaeon]